MQIRIAVRGLFLGVTGACLWLAASLSMAANPGLADIQARIGAALQKSHPDMVVQSVNPSPVPGLYEVRMKDGMLLYGTADGMYLIEGDIYRVMPGKLVDLTEASRAHDRARLLAQVPRKDMIIFSPLAPQKAKAAVYVFTDVDCGYCQKFHQQVPQLNAMGIEVRYLAWPRAGIGSDTYDKLVTAWCSPNRQETLTRFKRREEVPLAPCKDNPVAGQYRLGRGIGVQGTPALVFEDGQMQPGYVPADELAKMLLGPPAAR